MSERAIDLGVLIGAAAAALWVFGVHAPFPRMLPRASPSHGESRDSPLAVIPPGSAFVLTADLAQLRNAALGGVLAQRLSKLEAGGDLGKLCGFDPLVALDQLALAVPSAGLSSTEPGAHGEHGDDFGVVATGRFSAAQISRCASAVIAQRGGEAVQTKLGSFSSVRDRKSVSGEVAARDGGPLIVSGGSYFRELLDSAEGNAPKLEHQDLRDAHHTGLRQSLGRGSIVATWLLPQGWFERVSGDSAARLSPLRGLSAVGARLDVSQELRVTVLLESVDAAAASQIEALLAELRSSLAAVALEPALTRAATRVALDRQNTHLRLSLTLSALELSALLDTAFGPSDGAAPRAPPPVAGISSSEIQRIPARSAGAR